MLRHVNPVLVDRLLSPVCTLINGSRHLTVFTLIYSAETFPDLNVFYPDKWSDKCSKLDIQYPSKDILALELLKNKRQRETKPQTLCIVFTKRRCQRPRWGERNFSSHVTGDASVDADDKGSFFSLLLLSAPRTPRPTGQPGELRQAPPFPGTAQLASLFCWLLPSPGGRPPGPTWLSMVANIWFSQKTKEGKSSGIQ